MKTTIEIADPLLIAARREAEARGISLRTLVEEGLRRVLAERHERQKPFVLRDASVGGKGLHAGLREGDWDALRALLYEGRGG